MTIRRKLWISNILMVVIPILLTAVCVAVCLRTSLGSYWYSLEQMYQDENGIQSAQSLIYTYQEALWETDWSRFCDPVTGKMIGQDETMQLLEGKLTDMGYRIMVEKNGNVLYSSLSQEDVREARAVAGDAIYEAKTLTLSEPKISIVKNTFLHEGKVLSILAINSEEKSRQRSSYLQDYILRYIVLFVSVFFLGMIFVNLVLSRWISRSVLIPLKILGDGTKRIRNGELDSKLAYQKRMNLERYAGILRI